MLNQALPGDIHSVKPKVGESDKDITLTAVHRANGWAVAVVSAKPEAQKITITYPEQKSTAPWRVLSLTSATPLANNETAEEVRIVEQPITPEKNSISVTLNPYGFVVLVEN